jgi:hypothetical protein
MTFSKRRRSFKTVPFLVYVKNKQGLIKILLCKKLLSIIFCSRFGNDYETFKLQLAASLT